MHYRLFEQIVERLAGAGRSRGAGLTLDGRTGGKEGAGGPLVFRRHARGQRLRTLEPGAGIERDALNAAMKVDPAA